MDETAITRLDREAEHLRSPCGEGTMAWHAWGAGVPLVLLHGGYGSWMHWLRNIDFLKARYRVIAADLPGLGDSAMPPQPYTPQSLGAIVAQGIETVVPGSERLHLCGFSFGGLLSGQVAAILGERLRSATLVGAGGLGLTRQPTELISAKPGSSAEEVREIHRHNLATLMLRDPAKIDATALAIQTANVARARVKSRRFATADSLAQALRKVRVPLNGVWGEFDATAYPYLDAREKLLREIRSDVQFRIVPDAGHWVQYEAPDAFHAVLTELLSRG